jgi:beta-xylosidase
MIGLAAVAGAGALITHASAASRSPRRHELAVALRPPHLRDLATPGTTVPAGEDASDPVLYRLAGRYFLFTSDIGGPPLINVPVASGVDLESWGPVTDALPTLPEWAAPGYTWAPDVHRFGATYVLYFTAMLRDTFPTMECIGDAEGSAPDGPFHPRSQPFICQRNQGGSIDPRVFSNSQGSWMLWKSDQNIGGSDTPTKLWSQRLTPNGLGLAGQPAFLMGPDEPWQASIVEAPDMVEVGGAYWLFYSGNWFNQAAYAIGAARCAGPAGPCKDRSPLPLLASNFQGWGPGEESVFEDAEGAWLLYTPRHSSVPYLAVPPRPVEIARIGFRSSGPYLATWAAPPILNPLGPLPFASTLDEAQSAP